MRRLPTHAYFEGRLEEECERARRAGGAFAVVRLHVAPGTPAETATRDRGHAAAARETCSPRTAPTSTRCCCSEPDRQAGRERRPRGWSRSLEQPGNRRAQRRRLLSRPTPAPPTGSSPRPASGCRGGTSPGVPSSDEIRCGPEMRRIHLLARRAAASNINVLILGRDRGRQGGAGREHPRPVAARGDAVRAPQLRGAVALAARVRAVRARARRLHRRARGQAGTARDRRGGHGVARRDRRAAACRCRPSCCA